ncbi:MAG: L-serine ammonia-lyase, iron-sulfur-dependent, subunit alpha [Bifidobacteriaceae bacterium]|jgi:L-cysteine desulfidase|nr:L-serine ammonia-lyase, iron-sulfur-dependent, subunit alpha [Bifidobacteriaceae bacterium]
MMRVILENIGLIKIILGNLALLIILSQYIPYTIDIVKGKTQPAVFMWYGFAIVATYKLWIMMPAGAGWGSVGTWATLVSGIAYGTVGIFYFHIQKSSKVLNTLVVLINLLAPVLTVTGVITDLNYGILIAGIAGVISVVPGFVKSYNLPYSENLTSYALSFAGNAISILAVSSYNFESTLIPCVWTFINLSWTIYLIARRRIVDKAELKELEIQDVSTETMAEKNFHYDKYIEILNKELVVAMGCTEPIAISYATAKAKELFSGEPEYVKVEVSGNILKNVKSVVVPNTNNLKGVEASVAAGIIAGDPNKELEVISHVTDEQKKQIKQLVDKNIIGVEHLNSKCILDIRVTLKNAKHLSVVRVSEVHTNITYAQQDDKVLIDKKIDDDTTNPYADRMFMTVEDIFNFTESVHLSDVKSLLERQIKYNTAIADEGLKGNWGANIGSTLIHSYGQGIVNRAKAKAAAGSDARMSGCELPVVINGGSGNQGITVSVPVIEYAKELKAPYEKLLRALVLSNLVAIHQKNKLGRLSAYCGVVSAGAASACAIAYLKGGGLREIAHTLVNALAITSGIICDGAKPSCAAKIAASVDAGILGEDMFANGQQFYGGDGIVVKGVENTLENVGRLGKQGMKETDKEIIQMMIGK